MKQELIFVPTTGVGHIIPMLEFANRLLNPDDHITITILLKKLPLASFLDTYVKSHIGSQPRIQFVQLPEIAYPPQELLAKSAEGYIDSILENYKLHVRTVFVEIISSRSNSTEAVALVLDLFCGTMIDIGNEFGFHPRYT